MVQRLAFETQRTGQFDGQLRNTARVAACFLVAQFQGLRPTFDRLIVGPGQFIVLAFQIFQHFHVIHANRRLQRQRLQEHLPVIVSPEP